MDTTPDKKIKGQKKLGLPLLTAEDILKEGKTSLKEESPINLTFNIMKDIRLSPIEWENFSIPPKLMKISNSGTTAILSAKWHGPRPYLGNGPVDGQYVFSQLHFHWGRTFEEGSEHRINGESLPLEAHAMFFKNVYISQDDAMKRIDGIVTLAYFFELQEGDNESLNPITEALAGIATPLTSQHIEPVPLKQFIPSFTNDYFLYWGNVINMSVLWFICRKPLGISTKQLSSFQNLIGSDKKPIEKNFRETRNLNHRVVFHVNPSENKLHPLLPKEDERKREGKKNSVKVYSIPAVGRNVLNQALYTVAEQEAVSKDYIESNNDGNTEYVSEKNSKTCVFGDAEEDSVTDLLNFNLKKKPNVKELKYTLARILLELEKQENNEDFGVLENYIKAKYSADHEKLKREKSFYKTYENKGSTDESVANNDSLVKNRAVKTLVEDKNETHGIRGGNEKETSIVQLAGEEKEIAQDSDLDGKSNDEQSGKLVTRIKHTPSKTQIKNYNKRRCKSASDNEGVPRTPSKMMDETGPDSPEVLRTPKARLKIGKKESSHFVHERSGEMLAFRTSCEFEETLTILETTKSGPLRSPETVSSDTEDSTAFPEVRLTSEETIRKPVDNRRKTLLGFDMKAIKRRLKNQRANNMPQLTGGSKPSPNHTPIEKMAVEKKEANKAATLQVRDENESQRRRALIRKSMMKMMKERPQTENKNKPKTPDRPAWKP